ncbi:fucose 4-O-acetylase-like acetyltransferase [Planomicrobium soli]|uniref:Fucose 4-O-acetylase-like acetyltransferase n=2 Tax=Planomicrobium soli TaxID=1176648 RepID=A0A2P8H3E9_9BACL|nr:fucose 4-O-acetylase-like acetyltransferase [Planomicrobium soli]
MPALIVITGFLSKNFNRPGYIEKTVKTLLVPYMIFQIIFAYYYYLLYNKNVFTFDFFQPQFTMWFILSLFIWKCLLFIFTKIKHPLLWAIVVGVGIGYVESAGHYMNVQRTLTYFPFFMLGFYLKKEHFEIAKKRSARLVGFVIFAILWVVVTQFPAGEVQSWLAAHRSYVTNGHGQWYIGLKQLMFYSFSLLAGFAFLSFVPQRKTFFTHMGRRTAYIYILHGAIVRTLYVYVIEPEEFTTVWHYFQLPVYAIVLVLVLGSKPVNITMKFLIEGNIVDYVSAPIKWLAKKAEPTVQKMWSGFAKWINNLEKPINER